MQSEVDAWRQANERRSGPLVQGTSAPVGALTGGPSIFPQLQTYLQSSTHVHDLILSKRANILLFKEAHLHI
jgi:hypothetical protein